MTTTNGNGRQQGNHARAIKVKCGAPRLEDGRACQRRAGMGTDHRGEGPCVLHDDGSFVRTPLADNIEVRAAFIESVREHPDATTRELISPLGYHRRDVNELLDLDPVFKDEYEHARGYDVDTLRTEVRKRAFEGESDRLLEFLAKMRLPEALELQRHRLDGRLQVEAVNVKLAFEPMVQMPAALEAGEPLDELEP